MLDSEGRQKTGKLRPRIVDIALHLLSLLDRGGRQVNSSPAEDPVDLIHDLLEFLPDRIDMLAAVAKLRVKRRYFRVARCANRAACSVRS